MGLTKSSPCQHEFPNKSASLGCVHGSTGIGAENLSSLTGGFPYGIPRYASILRPSYVTTFLP